MKKSTLFMIVSVVLALTLSLGGTLAYLTDTDYDTNVMVLGNIDIEQHETDRTGAEFKQGQMMLPMVGSAADKDAAGYPAPQNYIDKIVTVENVGNYDAYVRTLIAIPTYEYEGKEENNASYNVLHWNGYSEGDAAPNYKAGAQYPVKTVSGTEFVAVDNHWSWGKDATKVWPGNGGDWNALEEVQIGAQKYTVYAVTHIEPVAPKARTAPNMIGLYLDERVDFNGEKYTLDDKIIKGFNGTVEVLVMTQAVQYDAGWAASDKDTDERDGAWNALNAAFGEFTVENIQKWFVKNYVVDQAGMDAAIAAGEKTIAVLDGEYKVNGINDLTIIGVGEATKVSIDGNIQNVNIKNATVVGGDSLNVQEGQTAYFENVTFEGNVGMTAQGVVKGDMTFKNCKFEKGFHIDQSTAETKVTFTGCTFGEYGYIKLGGSAQYAMNDCVIEPLASGATGPWGKQWLISYSDITFTGCEMGRLVRAGGPITITLDGCVDNFGVPVTEANVHTYNTPTVVIK